jgi:hypothetical protein
MDCGGVAKGQGVVGFVSRKTGLGDCEDFLKKAALEGTEVR